MTRHPKFAASLAASLFIAAVLGARSGCDAGLVYPEAPKGGRELFLADIAHDKWNTYAVLRAPGWTMLPPYRGYVVEWKDANAGNLLAGAKFESWHFLVVRGASVKGDAVLKVSGKDGKALKFDGFWRGIPFQAVYDALEMAKQLPQVQKQDYEVRYLTMSYEGFMAVWLHAASDDIIIPLSIGPSLKALTEKETVAILKNDNEDFLREVGGRGIYEASGEVGSS